jgi:hypothetical protein
VAGKRQVIVPGGIRKVIQTGGSTAQTATTIEGLEGLVVSIAQLKALLGVTTAATGTGGGSTSTAALVPGQGLLGGGALVGSVPLSLRFPTPPVIWNDALLPDDFVGGAASGSGAGGSSGVKITDGTNTVNGATQVSFTGATVGGSTPNATVTVAGGSTTAVLGNFTPDSHPASPDPNNDEFEGSALSAQWTITNPSTTTFATKQGYLRAVSNNAAVTTYVFEPLTNTTAFKYRAKCMMDLGATAFAFAGLCLYNSGNGHNIIWGPEQNASGRQAFYATALSGTYTSLGSETTLGNINAFVYLEIEMDATNVYLRSSQTGEEGTFNTVITQALSGNMGGATHIGFMFNGITSRFICDWIRRVDTGTVPSTGNAITNPNITPDTHPNSPTIYDDEFEFGLVLDTTGARSPGAQAWVVQAAASVIASVVTTQSQGAFQTLTYTGSVTPGIGVSQAVPGGTWEFTTKLRTSALVFYNSSTWKNIYFGYAGSANNYLAQTETRNWAAGTYSFNGSLGSFTSGYTGAPIYLKAKYDGTNLILSYSMTGLVSDFTQLLSTTVASWISTITNVGLANSNSCMGLDWFRRTA